MPGASVAASPTPDPNPGQTPFPMITQKATERATSPVPSTSVTHVPTPNATKPTSSVPRTSITPISTPPPMQTPISATPVVPFPLQKKTIANQRNNFKDQISRLCL